MTKLSTILILSLATQLCFGQNSFCSQSTDGKKTYQPPPIRIDEKGDTIYHLVDIPPQFSGGDDARLKFLQDNIRNPEIVRQGPSIQGTIYVTFVVERDGSITDIRILRGIGSGFEEEAIRVVQMMPKWIPGKQQGRPVRVQHIMPIKI